MQKKIKFLKFRKSMSRIKKGNGFRVLNERSF